MGWRAVCGGYCFGECGVTPGIGVSGSDVVGTTARVIRGDKRDTLGTHGLTRDLRYSARPVFSGFRGVRGIGGTIVSTTRGVCGTCISRVLGDNGCPRCGYCNVTCVLFTGRRGRLFGLLCVHSEGNRGVSSSAPFVGGICNVVRGDGKCSVRGAGLFRLRV